MNQQWSVPAGTGVVVLAVLVLAVVALAVALVRARGAARREREAGAQAAASMADLRAQVEAIQRRLADPQRSDGHEYVITDVGERAPLPRHAAGGPGTGGETPRVEPALFADLVLRESVVRAASLAHGLRVALSPESRNRIRFEVRREVRRARKDRRTETRLARREYAARRRAGLTDQPGNEDAA